MDLPITVRPRRFSCAVHAADIAQCLNSASRAGSSTSDTATCVVEPMPVTGVALIQKFEGGQADPLGAQRASMTEQLARAQLLKIRMGHVELIGIERHIQRLTFREDQRRADRPIWQPPVSPTALALPYAPKHEPSWKLLG